MQTLPTASAIFLILSGTLLAESPVRQTPRPKQKVEERTVFVTGSLIPQRIQLRPIGTATVSPLRIIDRNEIGRTGRFTTAGAFINEPALRIIGH